jgi:ribosomal protein S27AE
MDISSYYRYPRIWQSRDLNVFAFTFCPVCGDKFRATVLKAGEPERFVCRACGFIYYLDWTGATFGK